MASDENNDEDSPSDPQRAGLTRQLAGQSALLMMGNAFTLLAGFPFQIYVAQQVGSKNLGAFGLCDVFAQTIGALFGLGVGHVAVRFLPEYLAESKTRHIRSLLRNVYGIALATSVIGLALSFLCQFFWLDRIERIRPYSAEVAVMTLMIPVGMLLTISQQVLRGFFDIRYMVIMSSFLQLTLKIAFTLLFFWLGLQLLGYVLAVVVSSAVCLLGMMWGIRRHLARLPDAVDEEAPVNRKVWWDYGRVMYGNSLLGLASAPLERTLLAGVIDLSAVGVLVVIRQLQTFPQIFLQVIIAIVAPLFVAAKKLTDVAHLYHLATDWMCRLALPMMLFFLLRSDAILAVYGEDFSTTGSIALFIILVSQTVNLGCGPIGNLLNMKGQQATMFRVNIVASILLLAGIVTLVPLFGIVGIALSSAISTIVANVWALRVSKSKLSIRWFSRRYLRWLVPSVIGAGLLLLTAHTMPGDTKWWLCLEFVVCFIGFHLTYLLSGVCDEDRELVAMVRGRLVRMGLLSG